MKLHLKIPYLSIINFPDCEIPDLSVVHGRNGAGKTHMLKALQMGFHLEAYSEDKKLNCAYASDFSGVNLFQYNQPNIGEVERNYINEIQSMLINSEIIRNLIDKYITDDEKWAFSDDQNSIQILRDAAIKRAQNIDPDFIKKMESSIIDNIEINMPYLSDKIKYILEYTGIQLMDITTADLASSQWGVIGSNLLSPEIGFLFQRYRQTWLNHKRSQVRASLMGRNPIDDKVFIEKFGPPPWDAYNSRLENLNIKFRIKNPPERRDEQWGIVLEKDGQDINIEDISSGEKVIINLALSTLSKDSKSFKIHKPDVILLDEPDAHLHPSLVRDMFENFVNPIIREGTKVILTTHSPTTIAQVSEDSIYEKIENGGLIKSSKQHAIDRLLVGVPHISIDPTGRRQVFVEASEDEFVYQEIYNKYRDTVVSERSLSFIATGSHKNGGKDRVKSLTENLRNSGNTSIFGVIDWDSNENEKAFVFVNGLGTFYSIENLVMNPLLIGILITKFKCLAGFEKFNFIDTGNHSPSVLQEIIDSVEGFFTDTDITERCDVEIYRGFSLNISSSLAKMNGHDYENELMKKIPQLEEIKKNSARSMKKAIIKHVIGDFWQFLPKSVFDLFEKILKI